jgi:hypothetical protein
VFKKQVNYYNGQPSTQQTAACPDGYTGTGGSVQCAAGGYTGSWSVPNFDPSTKDSDGHYLVSGWTGACGNYATTVIAVCCPACPTCGGTDYNNYGSYGSTPTDNSQPPPPPPPGL